MLKEAHHHDIRFAGKKRVSEDLIKKKKKGFARKEEKKRRAYCDTNVSLGSGVAVCICATQRQ